MNLTGWQQENDDDDGVFPIHQQQQVQFLPKLSFLITQVYKYIHVVLYFFHL